MLKKVFVMTIVMLVANLALVPFAFASDSPDREAKFAEKVKAEITKLGTGPDAKVKVKLKDETKLDGYVSEVNEASFTVVDKKTGNAIPIPYPGVKQVRGHNQKTFIILAITLVAVIFIVGIIAASQKGF